MCPATSQGGIGMKRYVIRLSESERNRLTALVSKGRTAARKRLHAQVLLKADVSAAGAGWTDRQIVEALGVGERTVQAIRQRCVEEGLDAALDRKKQCRPSRQRVLDGAKEAHLVALCCGKVPAGQARWTLRLLADELVRLEIVDTVSHETVRQALKKTS
jgi:transposase